MSKSIVLDSECDVFWFLLSISVLTIGIKIIQEGWISLYGGMVTLQSVSASIFICVHTVTVYSSILYVVHIILLCGLHN